MKVTGFSRTAKDLAIREMEKEVKEHTAFFIARHEGGVSAFSLDKLRAKLRPHSRYLVVKNSLARRVLSQARLTLLAESLNGTCGMTLTQGDPVAPCRILVDFAKENQNFKIQGAYVNGSVLLPDEIRVLAALPPREVLLA
ncbi:MAG: 50S ribosomal protein L10, partial [Candidatus Omnitrophica bacterium]|nr:50S ribosomal protein L10 [Candidatus Omnitrophota bacterium]